jgi:SAM-dependent methyltransferase
MAAQDAFDLIEDRFNAALDESLNPDGPDALFRYVAEMGLAPGSAAVDVGCGEGEFAVELARRFGLTVTGVDPVERCVTAARAVAAPGVRFEVGAAGQLPFADGTVDLVWCRDVLSVVPDLVTAYRDFRRVLRPGGRALIYQMFATDLLSLDDAGFLFPALACVPESMRPETTETAIRSAGLRRDRCQVLGTQWGEYAQEHGGKPASRLLHAARLIRDPDRYIELFGQRNYEIKLADCLWHVYRMTGRLSGRVYLLSAPG